MASHAVLILTVGVVILPVVFAFIKATQGFTQSLSPSLAPGTELWDNIVAVFARYGLGRVMMNTLLIVVLISVGKTTLSFFAAAAFVYFRFPLSGFLFLAVLFTLMLPTEVLVISLYYLVTDMGIFNTYTALVLPFLASATGTLLFRQHFLQIPTELLEASMLDGAGWARFIRSILLPLSWNVIAALAVVEFVFVWNVYLWPFLVIQENARQMVQVGLSSLVTQQEVSHVGVLMAGVAATMIPPVLVFLALQERFIRGFSLSAER